MKTSTLTRRRLLAVTVAVTLSTLATTGSAFAQTPAPAPTLYFSAIPDEDETKLTARFNKVAAYLSKELGFPVQYVPLKSYPASVTAFKNDQIQLAWFGGLTGVQAQRAVPGSQFAPLGRNSCPGPHCRHALQGLGGEVAISTTSVSVPVFSIPCSHQGGR